MPSPRLRSRSFRRIFVKTPGGRVNLHYRKKKPGIVKCVICKKPLHGVPRERPFKIKNMPKTKKRPERLYGGALCSSCTRNIIKDNIHKGEV